MRVHSLQTSEKLDIITSSWRNRINYSQTELLCKNSHTWHIQYLYPHLTVLTTQLARHRANDHGHQLTSLYADLTILTINSSFYLSLKCAVQWQPASVTYWYTLLDISTMSILADSIIYCFIIIGRLIADVAYSWAILNKADTRILCQKVHAKFWSNVKHGAQPTKRSLKFKGINHSRLLTVLSRPAGVINNFVYLIISLLGPAKSYWLMNVD